VASKRELQALIVLAGKVDPSLQKALKEADRQTRKLGESTKWFGNIASKTFTAMKVGVAVGAAGIGAAMVWVGKTGLQLASDLTEVQNVVDVTFRDNAKLIDQWAKSAKNNFGLSELAAKKYASTVGAMFKSMGVTEQYVAPMSMKIAELAADFASFYNLDHDEAFEKIRAGISGETEPLKQLGINMSVANLEAFRLSKGIKTAYEKMSAADQAILRFNYLLSVSKDAQGDFNRNIDSFANQSRLFRTNIQELAARIMSGAIPAFEKLLARGNELMESFMDDPEMLGRIQTVIENLFDRVIQGIPTAIDYGRKFVRTLVDIFEGAARVFQFIDKNWEYIKPTILGIVGAMIAWRAVTTTMMVINTVTTMLNGMKMALQFLTIAKWKDIAATTYLQALYARDAIVKGASTAATWAWTAATKAARIGTLAAAAAQWVLNSAILANPMTWVVVGVVAAIAALVAAFIWMRNNWDKVQSFLTETWLRVKKAFYEGVNFIIDQLNWLIEKVNKIPGVEIPVIAKLDTSAVDAALEAQRQTSGTTEKIQGFAKGGLATRPSIFGEAGPEMAIPIKRTPRSLGLLNQTARMLGVDGFGGGSPQFVFAPQITGGNAAEIEKTLRPLADEMFDMFDQWWEAKRREQFA